jgi:hypothetical protein
MQRALIIAVLVACQPKQPLQASYFNAEQQAQRPRCSDTLACYGTCTPLSTDEKCAREVQICAR